MKRPKPTAWLWWLALLITGVATGLVYYYKQDTGNITAEENIRITIMFAVVAVGLCIISATSNWWVRR